MLNEIDAAILNILQQNCRMPLTEIAEHVGMSIQAVSERIRKMEARGIIRRYAAIVDPAEVGKQMTAFIQVLIEHPRFDVDFSRAMSEIPEVLECHHVAGECSYLLKVKTGSPKELEQLLGDRIRTAEGVTRTITIVALSTSKEETALPIPGPPARLAGAARH